MKSSLSLPFLGFLFLVGCTKPEMATMSAAPPAGIVNGQEVSNDDGAARSTVALLNQVGGHQIICTGSFIAKDTVLTAAHCVDQGTSKMVIIFSNRIARATSSEIRKATASVQHPRWKSPDSEGRGDLAVVHFEGSLPEGARIASLASSRLSLQEGEDVLFLGYGVTGKLANPGDGILRATTSTIQAQISPTEIVTDARSSSICFGDSGGPAFVRQGKRLVQWGVASAVLNKACNEASVHTDVSSYRAWIQSASAQMRKGSGLRSFENF